MPVSESIFSGRAMVIPLAEVLFVEVSGRDDSGGPFITIVIRGAQHPTDGQGNYMGGYGRADCPSLSGEEAKSFLAAWCYYRAEVEGLLDEGVPAPTVNTLLERIAVALERRAAPEPEYEYTFAGTTTLQTLLSLGWQDLGRDDLGLLQGACYHILRRPRRVPPREKGESTGG